jgi:amino acid adenylation domain-containing protein
MALTTVDFLGHLRQRDVEVRAKDGKLLLNAPAGTLTPELQAELRRRKHEILEFLLNNNVPDEESWAPLTYAQQRLWLIDRFSPGTVEYNIPQSWLVERAIDLDALRRVIDLLAERHPALRTRIEIRNGEPVQVVVAHIEIPLQVTDLSAGMNEQIQQRELDTLLVREGRKPFALHQAPLIRFHIFRLEADRYLLSYTIHHIVADQWALGVLKRDLTALYLEATSGRAAELPVLALAYSEIAGWERSEAANRLYARQLGYWRERLLGVPALLELPFSKSRPAHQTSEGATLSITLDAGLTKSLRQHAARSNTSIYLLMLTIFATLLHRYTGQTDICLGTPITGRKRREEESVVGLFLNMLPIRCTVDPHASFNQLLRRTSSAILADFEQSDVPFQRLVMELQPERSPAYSPFFQILFALNPKGIDADDGQREIFIGTSKFDLTLQIAERHHTLDAHFEYRTDLFDAADIEQFSRHFVRLAEFVVEAPEDAVGALPLLTREDLDAFKPWNATALPFDRSDTLTSIFEAQATLHPDALSLCCGEITLTYRELQKRANRLAISLRTAQVGPGNFVAICLDRSPDLIISILAVLQTGAAYLPLDPKYPEQRLDFMLRDSRAQVMIAQQGDLSARLVGGNPGLKLLFAEYEFSRASFDQSVAQASSLQPGKPEDAAYLIYTSGSTGTPKGVVVEQRNAVALIAWARSYFDKDSLRGVLASTSVCFDLSIFEIFLPLSTGNMMVLVNDVLELPSCPHAELVTLINTVPSAMSALLQTKLPPSVNTVCMAGEFLPAELVDRVYATGVARVFDLYGPTETTTYSTCALRLPGAPASIGQPIGNTRIYLLDENLLQVPPGALGEIFISGEGVTRGYLDRPELTGERFLTLPAVEPQGRLYRTGDLARQLGDGSLVYLGRRDQQVKLRGHRIELGEMETALREVSGASDVAVVVQKRKAGDTLVAFMVEREAGQTKGKEYLAALRKRLPAYLIPGLIIPVAALPLTPNGKLDRKALSLATEAEFTPANEPPRDLLEQCLANIWAGNLGKKHIARNAQFFDDLGGHSLAAFEIFAAIEMRMGAVMGLATLFQAPTVELLAMAVRRHGWDEPRHLTFLVPGSAEKVIYLVGQQPSVRIDALRTADERVMAVGANGRVDDIEGWVREIASLENNRPALVFATSSTTLEETRKLASKLAHAGFDDISLHVL